MREPLEIVFSTYDDAKNPFYGGGGPRAIHEVARRLAREHRVTVLTGAYPGARPENIVGVRYERIGWALTRPRLAQLLFHAALPRHVLRRKFDIWLESFTPPFSTSGLPLYTSRPVIGLGHLLSGDLMCWKYKLPFHLIESAGLRVYRHFIVLTQESGDKVRRINRRADIEIIPNGIDRPALPIAASPKTHLLFLGRIEVGQKGLDFLLRAYARIAAQTSCPLVIAGAGMAKDENKLRWLIADCGVGGSVKWLGRIEGARKAELLRSAACLVATSRFETLSLSTLEALAFGVPVITFDIEDFAWLPAQGAVKIKPFDEGALAEAMLAAAHGRLPATANQSALDGPFWAQFDWEHVAGRYREYIQRVVSAAQ